ncbi:LexA family protein [Marinicauda sp. Alg238-R41]|uniref:LexA family protein n=1 Tax=Marinicauda sp. Alg238-R41 TaxID=2993447 RepID=UPI0022E4726B|nr:hypothetical protein [Marinicauda sp. Alg238-R41]
MTTSLTPRERSVLAILQHRIDETAICPTFVEMRDALGLKSPSGVHAALQSLQEKKWIRRDRHRQGVEILQRLPEAALAQALREIEKGAKAS